MGVDTPWGLGWGSHLLLVHLAGLNCEPGTGLGAVGLPAHSRTSQPSEEGKQSRRLFFSSLCPHREQPATEQKEANASV